MWAEDAKIDKINIGEESIKFTTLHHKYYEIYSQERLLLKKLHSDLKVLKLQKFEFYAYGPDEESEQKGWKLPAIGKILRTDVPTYVDADKDVIDLSLRIGIQSEKVDYLESILKALTTRGFSIKNYLEFVRFTAGG